MHDQMNIRDARLGDADTLAEFNVRMAKETEDKQLNPDVVKAGVKAVLQNDALGFYLVAEMDEKVVASLMVTTEWSDWRNGTFWWIQSVYVVPEYRRRGLFHALYEDVRQRAQKTKQICGFRLYVERNNVAAQATYKSLGMSETKYRLFEEPLQ